MVNRETVVRMRASQTVEYSKAKDFGEHQLIFFRSRAFVLLRNICQVQFGRIYLICEAMIDKDDP